MAKHPGVEQWLQYTASAVHSCGNSSRFTRDSLFIPPGGGNRIGVRDVLYGDIYQAQELPRVPHTLREATALFENSAFTRSVLGDDVVDHYAHFLHVEQAAYDTAVTDWERRRYFERI